MLVAPVYVAPRTPSPCRFTMLWFLERHSEVLICEIRQAPDSQEFELVISAPGIPERVERFGEPSALLERWLACQQQLRAMGWRPRS